MPKIINLLSYHVAEDIERYIYVNKLQAGDKLLPERSMAKLYNITRVTLRKGLQKLIDDGIIYNIPSNGYFVSHKQITRDATNLFFLGSDNPINLFNYKKTQTDFEDFSYKTLKPVFKDKVLLPQQINSYIELINDIPISLCYTIQSEDSLSNYPNLFQKKKPSHLTQNQSIRIYHPNDLEIQLLKITTNDTLFVVSESVYDKNTLIAVCESICVGSRCELDFTIHTSTTLI